MITTVSKEQSQNRTTKNTTADYSKEDVVRSKFEANKQNWEEFKINTMTLLPLLLLSFVFFIQNLLLPFVVKVNQTK